MSGGGGSQTSTTVQKADPWSGVQPYLTQAYQTASNLYNGPGPAYYPGSTYVQMSPETSAGLGALYDFGAYNPNTAAANAQLADTLSGQYLGANPSISAYSPFASGQMTGQNPAYSPYAAFASGQMTGSNPGYSLFAPWASGAMSGANPTLGLGLPLAAGAGVGGNPGEAALAPLAFGGGANNAYNPAYGALTGYAYSNPYQNPAFSYLGAEASGANVGSNPYVDATYDKASQAMADAYRYATAPSTAAQFELAGGYGSPSYLQQDSLNRQDLARGLGDLATSIYGGAYESDRTRQLQAGSQLGQFYNAGQQVGLSGAGQLGSLYQSGANQDIANQISAAQGLGGLYGQDVSQQLQALGLTGQLGEGALSRQYGASQDIASLYGQDLANQLAGAQGLGGLYQADLQNQLQAIAGQSAAYQAERNNQLQALGLSPTVQGMNLTDINAMIQAGQTGEGYSQSALQDAINRYNYQQQLPYNQLNQYLALLNGASGGTTTGTSVVPNQNNSFMQMAGLGLSALPLMFLL